MNINQIMAAVNSGRNAIGTVPTNPNPTQQPKLDEVKANPAPKLPPKPAPKPAPPPELNLPDLTFSGDTSVVNQLDKITSKDSILNQQARIQAREHGVASGGIHSSQQEGAAQKMIYDRAQPLAEAEAGRAALQEMSNWETSVKQNLEVYQQSYRERLDKMGYDNSQKLAMVSANTQLSATLMSSITSLMNNTDLEFSEGYRDKLVEILNTSLDNNNLTLEMGFTY